MELIELLDFAVKGWDNPNGTAPWDIKTQIQDRVLYIAFPPTQGNFFSWIVNLLAYSMLGIHFGFYAAYFLAVKRVKDTAIRLGVKEIHFTGFSRGGAMAEIGACDAYFNEFNTKATSFAAPKWSLRPKFGKITRYEVGGDIVPQLPPFYWSPRVRVRIQWRTIPSFTAHSPAVYREALRKL